MIPVASVSFQGERGAYSEAAAASFFGGEAETLPCATFAEALESAAGGRTDYAILPVENSIEGSVGESHDLLYGTPLSAVGEAYHRIEHCLIGGGGLDEVDTVYSHPQALGQCRRFIRERGMRTVPAYDTAGSVGIVKDMGRPNVACIASRQAADIHGMSVIRGDIADNTDNYTRFLIMAAGRSSDPRNDKTSVVFSVRHEEGALYRVMERFHRGGINLTKIESRPTRSAAWEYNFYVDFEGNEEDPGTAEAIDGIRGDTLFFKSLGSYRAARPG